MVCLGKLFHWGQIAKGHVRRANIIAPCQLDRDIFAFQKCQESTCCGICRRCKLRWWHFCRAPKPANADRRRNPGFFGSLDARAPCRNGLPEHAEILSLPHWRPPQRVQLLPRTPDCCPPISLHRNLHLLGVATTG